MQKQHGVCAAATPASILGSRDALVATRAPSAMKRDLGALETT